MRDQNPLVNYILQFLFRTSKLLNRFTLLTNGLFSVSSGERGDQPSDGGAVGGHRRPRHRHQPAGRRQHQAQGEDHLPQELTAGPGGLPTTGFLPSTLR
jgi:hypothetical protein